MAGTNSIGAPTGLHGEQKRGRVFVVHGRNLAARDSIFALLRALGLMPIEWDQAVAMTGKGSPYIGEVLDVAFEQGQAVIVLMTPDDIAYLQNAYANGDDDPDTRAAGQARPNVLFEAGMAMGRNEDRTILVELGDLRPFSDVAGRYAIRMTDTPEKRKALAQRLQTAGCSVDMSGSDWMSAGDFRPPPKPGGGMPLGKRVPTTRRTGVSLDAHWHTMGGNHVDQLKITNNGALAVFDVLVELPEGLAGVKIWQEGPLARLPPGKSFTLRAHAFGNGGPDQFDVIIKGRTDDGTEIREEVFIDTVG
jgi:predicted nucleotide-binding protein